MAHAWATNVQQADGTRDFVAAGRESTATSRWPVRGDGDPPARKLTAIGASGPPRLHPALAADPPRLATVGDMVTSWITPKARKGAASVIAGSGLHAIESIAAGEVVAVKGGHLVTTQQLHELADPLPNSDVQVADDLHLVALTDAEYEPVMLFINHSCEPNVGFGGNIVLVAMHDIAAGEELTTDYTLFDDYDGQMTCHCATGGCRGTIDGRDWQLPELQHAHRGYFSWYLQRRIDDLRGPSRS